MGHGKGWALVKNEWHRVLTRLASLPYGLILISHAVDKTIETRTGEYTKTTPSLPDRARNVVLGLVDIILYGDSVSRKDAAGNLVVDRVLRTKPHPTYEAGDRTGRLPDVLPLEYAAFHSAFVASRLQAAKSHLFPRFRRLCHRWVFAWVMIARIPASILARADTLAE